MKLLCLGSFFHSFVPVLDFDIDFGFCNCAQHWNRRWFVLDGSKLYYLKDDASRQKMLICDVKLCTVKVRRLIDWVSVG